jgi:hypothetical protein
MLVGMACAAHTPAAAKGSGMQVKLTLSSTTIARGSDLEAKVVIVNQTAAPVKLNTTWLSFPSLVLRVRDAAGKLIPLGPPPTPRADDGESGRQLLPPNGTIAFDYRAIFGTEPPHGQYSIAFETILRKGPKGTDWDGPLASDAVKFEIKPQ